MNPSSHYATHSTRCRWNGERRPAQFDDVDGHRRGIRPDVVDAVATIDVDDARTPGPRRRVVQLRIGDDDDEVALVDEVRGRAVDPEHAAAALPLDDVRLESGAVRHVDDGHLFAR